MRNYTLVHSKERITQVLELAARSPSSHNTQPWLITIKGQNLLIGYDEKRHLKIGDPEKRELFLSLGCFIETLTLAAKAYGFKSYYKFAGNNRLNVAVVELTNTNTKNQDLVRIIKNRRSDRRFYEKKQLDKAHAKKLSRLSRGRSKLYLTDNEKHLVLLSKLTHKATYKLMSPQNFRDELAGWVRNNWTQKPDGMPGYTQGMPGPISLVAKFVIKKTKKVANDQAKKDAKRIKHSSAVGIIYTIDETHSGWIDAGRLYQTICLEASRFGIKSSAISAAIILPETSRTVKESFGLKGEPVALIRLGYKNKSVKASPRLSPVQFIIKT